MNTCAYCGSKTNNKKLCSQRCAGLFASAAVKGTQRKPRHPCEKCGSPTLGRFCSRSCAASVTNHERRIVKECLACGAEFSNSTSKCCSQTCGQKYLHDTRIERWLAGEWSGSTENGEMSQSVRRWVFSLKGEQCWKCGWNTKHPLSGKAPLQVDHVDGDYSNNQPSNLQLLCPNCHALTENWGGYNRGKGRKYRYSGVRGVSGEHITLPR